jgi:hypothetical protein
MLQLREHQLEVVEKLRHGFESGHRCQLLYAPTGFGKTEVAMAIMHEVSKNYKRTAMVLDRIVLVDQTSLRLGKYDIPHGVMQSGHWRHRPYERIQICSAQTLEKRGSFPDIDLLIIDECHVTRKGTIKFIKDNPHVKVVGLTATPFTKGLGNTYTHVVGATSTGDLIDKGWLTQLRVFIAKEIDMTGVKKLAGEWSADQVTERGMRLTGDIVTEWVKKTHEVFGMPRKTVVFCAGVEHGRDLERQFQEAGYNFASISYKEDDEYKRMIIEDFARPDTKINGLIATDILTKGFDVPDVMIGVSARPFSKSFSSHVQQLGRVMRPCEGKEFALWLCLAKGSRVLTDKGLVAIDKVTLGHKIWDGTNFVNHGGAVCNGTQKVITYQGLTATEGHLVHTKKGWRTFGNCAREQIRITQTGLGGTPIRIGEDLRSKCFLAGRKAQEIYSRAVRVCGMWIQKLNFFVEPQERKDKGLSSVQPTGTSLSNVVIQQSSSNASKVLFNFKRTVSGLRRERGRVQIQWSETRNHVDHGEFGFAGVQVGSRSFTGTAGQDRPIWTLRAGQPEMDFCGAESAQQARQSSCSSDAQIQNRLSKYRLCRQYVEAFVLGWNDGRTNSESLPPTINQTEREVWDILDAGQHNRFTCEGLLVHNCHSGNYLRFRDDWDELYNDGVKRLKEEGEKAKKEPTEREKKEAKCPACGILWTFPDNKCGGCGYMRPQRQNIVAVPGELEELANANKKLHSNNQDFYSQLIFYGRSRGFKEGWAAYKYKERFGVFPRGLRESPQQPSMETMNWIKHRAIAYSKGVRK